MRPARPIRPKGATENDDDKVVSPLADYIREPIGGNRCLGRKKLEKWFRIHGSQIYQSCAPATRLSLND